MRSPLKSLQIVENCTIFELGNRPHHMLGTEAFWPGGRGRALSARIGHFYLTWLRFMIIRLPCRQVVSLSNRFPCSTWISIVSAQLLGGVSPQE